LVSAFRPESDRREGERREPEASGASGTPTDRDPKEKPLRAPAALLPAGSEELRHARSGPEAARGTSRLKPRADCCTLSEGDPTDRGEPWRSWTSTRGGGSETSRPSRSWWALFRRPCNASATGRDVA